MDCYVFDTEQEAIDAEARISVLGGCPITANGASEDKQKTVRWATPRERATDSKWFIPRPPEHLRDLHSSSTRSQFATDHPHTVEAKQPGWSP